jgi:hypothetical protein
VRRWFVWGSFGCGISAVVPLIQQYLTFYHQHDDLLPAIDFEITWALLIVSGRFRHRTTVTTVTTFTTPSFYRPTPASNIHLPRIVVCRNFLLIAGFVRIFLHIGLVGVCTRIRGASEKGSLLV